MCKYCNEDSDEIFQDSLTGDWYLKVDNQSWDYYNDDFDYTYTKVYINYCPWCGRKLEESGE